LDDVTAFIKQQGVATYKLPERLEIIDAIPRTPVGKIIKGKLREDIRKKLEGEK
jgi:non-ribosomal peptide synthetase component E (peptide arylation enzyme)